MPETTEKKEFVRTINIRPTWVVLVGEYSRIIQNNWLKLQEPRLDRETIEQCRQNIENAEKELKKPAKIADIILESFDNGATFVKFTKDKDGNLVAEDDLPEKEG